MFLVLAIFLIIPCQSFASIYGIMAFNSATKQMQDNQQAQADYQERQLQIEQEQEIIDEKKRELQAINDQTAAQEQWLANYQAMKEQKESQKACYEGCVDRNGTYAQCKQECG